MVDGTLSGQHVLQLLCMHVRAAELYDVAAGVFMFFGLWHMLAGLFVYFLLPETRGIPLEQVRHLLRSSSCCMQWA